MREVGRVDARLGPSAYAVGHAEGYGTRFMGVLADVADEEGVFAAIGAEVAPLG